MKKIVILDNQNFEDFLKNSFKPVLVDFWAPWCGPCKMISPILDDLSEDMDDVVIAKLDVQENPEIASKFGIRSIPTMILFKDNERVAIKTGAGSKDQIKSFIDNNK